jgi:hypothetical protein
MEHFSGWSIKQAHTIKTAPNLKWQILSWFLKPILKIGFFIVKIFPLGNSLGKITVLGYCTTLFL